MNDITLLLFALWVMTALIYWDIRVMIKRLHHPLVLIQRIVETNEKENKDV
jgi:hypothetical protein